MVTRLSLDSLLARAKKDGWATGHGTVPQVVADAHRLGLVEVPVRKGDPPVTKLRPVSKENARPNSLSSRYGKGNQPLHTDGAHLIDPPDFVVLLCNGVSDTPTFLAKPKLHGIDYTAHGVFLVVNGRDSFFSTAWSGTRLRYDPGCMTPCDARARKAAEQLKALRKAAHEHSWEEPGLVLVIDNKLTLHARGQVPEDEDRVIERVGLRYKVKES